VDDISDEHLLEVYMGGLKEDIKHEIFLRHPVNIMEVMQFSHHIQAKNKSTHKSTIGAYTRSKYYFGVHKKSVPQSTGLTPQQMDERRTKGPCFNCDKYCKGNKCGEKKLFYIHYEEKKDKELEPQQDPNLKETTQIIYCHALDNINTPKTLKI
jgi:hypothetical protein